MSQPRLRLREILGLKPLGPALRQCWHAVAGDGYSPPSRFGPSSLKILRPRIALPLWLGRARPDRKVIIYLLPNRVPAPPAEGYSVRVTFARDYRGRQLTYDGHVGTDFAVPPGTPVVAAASGVVRGLRSDMQRGGLKLVVDHGSGLATMSCHLARALVRPGQAVRRGDVLGLSGMSGIDGVLFSPWLAPHLHFNVLLDGEAVCPFAAPGETAVWRTGNQPRPAPEPTSGPAEPAPPPTRWSAEGVAAAIDACHNPTLRHALQAAPDLAQQAIDVAVARVLHRHAFHALPPLVDTPTPRRPLLDLPFEAARFSGSILADDPQVTGRRS